MVKSIIEAFQRPPRRLPARARKYLPDPGLEDAIKVALLLGQPLLVTGEPGTGKTQLAYFLAAHLRLGEPLRFDTKSTSAARDLFYTYDALGRFHAAQIQKSALRYEKEAPENGFRKEALRYLTYNALGMAILLANEPQRPLAQGGRERIKDYLPPGFEHPGEARRSVVLIDEIDKAPRDFPNDLLNEVEGMYFRIPELGNIRIDAPPEMQPILVIASNSEKNLPDAFLRRCVYYHIPFPDEKQLRSIVKAQLDDFALDHSNGFLSAVFDLFLRLRDDSSDLRKKPATAELLGWLIALQEKAEEDLKPLDKWSVLRSTLSTLIKKEDDQERILRIAEEWTKKRSENQG